MWQYIKVITAIVIVSIVFAFSIMIIISNVDTLNTRLKFTLDLLIGDPKVSSITVYWVIFISFMSGLLGTAILSLFFLLMLNSKSSKLKQEIKMLKRENQSLKYGERSGSQMSQPQEYEETGSTESTGEEVKETDEI